MQALLMLPVAVYFHWSAAMAQDDALEKQYLDLVKQREQLSRSVRLLHEETRLSQDTHPYLVVDLRAQQMILKGHGLPMKQIALLKVQKLGRLACSTEAAFLAPDENAQSIKLSSSEGSDPEKLISVSDMPQAYDLAFGRGDRAVTLSIRPASSTLLGRAWLNVSARFQSGGYAVVQAFGSDRPAYRLILSPEDAQALYWAIEKGWPTLLICD